MAGRPKMGIEFAGWNVDIFENDTKIDELIDAQGWIGFCIYFYLCQKAYASDGYFYRWSFANAPTTARRMGGGIGSKTVIETVRKCLQIGLYDAGLFDECGILTSKGIQRRFYEVVKRRTYKTVIREYWLLSDEESEGLSFCTIPCGESNNDRCKNRDSLHKDGHSPHEHPPKSKVKESTVKESTVNNDVRARDGGLIAYLTSNLTHMSAGNMEELREMMADGMTEELVRYAVDIACGRNIRTWAYVRGILDRWICGEIHTLAEAKEESRRKNDAKGRGHPYGEDKPRATSDGEEIW